MELKVIQPGQDRQECIASVIETLEHVLAQARAGKVVAVGVALVRPNMAINHCRSLTDSLGTLLGAMALLQGRALDDLED